MFASLKLILLQPQPNGLFYIEFILEIKTIEKLLYYQKQLHEKAIILLDDGIMNFEHELMPFHQLELFDDLDQNDDRMMHGIYL
jgi:hypothetical protein